MVKASEGDTAMLFKFLTTKKMEPRPGQRFATEYYKMRREERNRLRDHIVQSCTEMWRAWDRNPELEQYAHRPLKNFKRVNQQNRSVYDIVTEQLEEATGTKRNGDPKDFALAPIERWNKLFVDTDFEIKMQLEYSARPNNFHKLYEELV